MAQLAVDVPGEHPQPDAELRGGQTGAPGVDIVSVRSPTSVRSSLSKSTTGAAGVRSTGSPNSRIGVTLTRRS